MPKSKPKSRSVVATLPWWLAAGEELCPHCGQLYAYEIEFRCPDCDDPSCPNCKVLNVREHRFVCVSCVNTDDPRGAHA